MSLELFPSVGVIDIDSITHLDIIVLSRGRRLGIPVVGYLDFIILSSSGRTSVLVVGHCRIMDSFRD
jgi:hypothetical protein